jgi:signal transduction histidine kinase
VLERSGELRIAVRDDGKGFDPDAPSVGFGLTGMRERISLAGGRLDIESSALGTIVTALIPSAPDVRKTA